MKHSLGWLLLTISILPAPAQTPAGDQTAGAPAPAEHKHIVFHPTSDDSSGIAPIQVGGGSRADKAADVVPISVLVPNQLALTTQAQPALYWYQPSATRHYCEITVSQPKHPKPLLELKTADSTPAGIHAIRLSKFNVKLAPNIVYEWNVALVLDPDNRSGDIIARGTIKRIDPTPEMAAKLASASDADKPAIYAENSIWYDALQSISDQIDHDPKNQALRDERADLLTQVGLKGKDMEETVVQGH